VAEAEKVVPAGLEVAALTVVTVAVAGLAEAKRIKTKVTVIVDMETITRRKVKQSRL